MKTLTIRTDNTHALKMLEELEALKLIQVIRKSVVKQQSKTLSERLAGSITSDQAALMRKELTEMRDGWQRGI
jgi:hypothetical protein